MKKLSSLGTGMGLARKRGNMNIVLIGCMGCGKSTIGVKLSYFLRQPLIDTDKQIERNAGCSISEIFAKQGEECFRQMETQCLEKLLQEKLQGLEFSQGVISVNVNDLTRQALGTDTAVVKDLRCTQGTLYLRPVSAGDLLGSLFGKNG